MAQENRPQFRLNVASEAFFDVEQHVARNWYDEQISHLPEMKVERFAATGEGGWEARLTPEGRVDSISGSILTSKEERLLLQLLDGISH